MGEDDGGARRRLPWIPFAAVLLGALAPVGLAGADDGTSVRSSGHVKTVAQVTFPYDHLLMPEDPTAAASVNARWGLDLSLGGIAQVKLHPYLHLQTGQAGGFLSTGLGGSAPEALGMSSTFFSTDSASLRFRMDWAFLQLDLGRFRITAGRQPISFGEAAMFTPLDLFQPFTATAVDTSYKPGIDALRADLFWGTSGQVSLVGAYFGSWDFEGTGISIYGKGTIGTVDLAGFFGYMYAEPVAGVSAYVPVGPVGLYTDLTLTFDDKTPEFRGVLGMLSQPGPRTTLIVEVYGQSFGTMEPSRYLETYLGARFERGELWLTGHLYLGAVLAQELTPVLYLNTTLITAFLDDPVSALLMPSLSWSVAENADLSLGVMLGLGKRPEQVEPADLLDENFQPYEGKALTRRLGVRSEFGLVPPTVFLQGGFYF